MTMTEGEGEGGREGGRERERQRGREKERERLVDYQHGRHICNPTEALSCIDTSMVNMKT